MSFIVGEDESSERRSWTQNNTKKRTNIKAEETIFKKQQATYIVYNPENTYKYTTTLRYGKE